MEQLRSCAHHTRAMEPRLHTPKPVYLKLVNMMPTIDLNMCPDKAECMQGSMWSSCTGTWGSRAT